ncbi:MAG: AI-2E family transporter, partial [Anaerococcus sp.]|nr:AI-2E family transporter [Anaerococcus sp.]
MDNKKLYERIILRTGIIILLCYFIKYWAVNIIDALLPIILAIILVMLLAPTIKKIDDLLPIKNTVISYVVGTILLIVILFLLFWFLQFIINQVSGLIGNIIGNWDQIVSSTNQWIQSINSKINLLPTFAANTIRSSLDSLYQFLGNLQKNVINITFGFTTAFINTSNNIIFFVITFIVAFYIMLGDINEVSVKYNTKFSENIKNKLKLVKNIFKNSTWKYIKAQLKLAILCTILM